MAHKLTVFKVKYIVWNIICSYIQFVNVCVLVPVRVRVRILFNLFLFSPPKIIQKFSKDSGKK